MARFFVSDHHFGHGRIIEYTDRPFGSPGEMDDAMLDRHYETVGADDVLVHLGDVAMDMRDGRETVEYFQRLGGDVLVRGNHDVGLDPAEAPFPVLDACTLEADGYRFYCTHRPEDAPEAWDGWAIHGHEHDNHPEEFPFLACEERRINVSVELLGYRPIRLAELIALLDAAPPDSRFRDLETARAELDVEADYSP
jgi:calcineurin-like phosphoesterase family protein